MAWNTTSCKCEKLFFFLWYLRLLSKLTRFHLAYFPFRNFNFRNFEVNEYAPREAFLFTGCWDADSWAARCPQSTQLSTSAPCLKGHLSNLTFSALTKGFLNIQTSSPPFRVYVFSSICLLLYKPFLTMRSSSVSEDVGGAEGGILSTCNVQ